mmetsp:Transcript_31708/g.53278  ORF Transcript_31708/g.53278 Transcript_31708/m.53278 type:complete len:211 (+) Transcript_31708:58-690(+)
MQFLNNVAAADELTLRVELRVRGPIGELLQALPDLRVGQDVERLKRNTRFLQRRDHPRTKAALRRISVALHEQEHILGLQELLDPLIQTGRGGGRLHGRCSLGRLHMKVNLLYQLGGIHTLYLIHHRTVLEEYEEGDCLDVVLLSQVRLRFRLYPIECSVRIFLCQLGEYYIHLLAWLAPIGPEVNHHRGRAAKGLVQILGGDDGGKSHA